MGKHDEKKAKKIPYKYEVTEKPLNKESEDLFKIAFRNYINLIAIADRKAGLLIQVNAILASVIIGFVAKKIQDIPLLIIPAAAILAVAGVTIFFSIMASKPLGKNFLKDVTYDKEPFFFGSFDKMDPDFQHKQLESYYNDMIELFSDEKKLVFDELIKESFEVRKVLSKKFNYLDVAYKVFFAGLVLVIITFLIVIAIMPSE